jgi:hypothetical protein
MTEEKGNLFRSCLLLCAIFGVVGLIVLASFAVLGRKVSGTFTKIGTPDNPIEVVGGGRLILDGDTAIIEMTVHSENTVEEAASLVAEAVWAAGQTVTPKKIVVKLKMSHDNLATTEDQPMGQMEVTDMREVQKYRTRRSYGTNASVRASYVVQIQQMKYANLFKPRQAGH